jgi:hypothetical protein
MSHSKRKIAFTLWTFVVLAMLLCSTVHVSHAQATTLRVIWFAWNPCTQLSSLAEQFQGANVEVTCVPNPEWHGVITTMFEAASNEYDLVVIDSQWVGESQPHLIELTDVVESFDLEDFYTDQLRFYGEYPDHSRRYYAMPMQGDV